MAKIVFILLNICQLLAFNACSSVLYVYTTTYSTLFTFYSLHLTVNKLFVKDFGSTPHYCPFEIKGWQCNC